MDKAVIAVIIGGIVTILTGAVFVVGGRNTRVSQGDNGLVIETFYQQGIPLDALRPLHVALDRQKETIKLLQSRARWLWRATVCSCGIAALALIGVWWLLPSHQASAGSSSSPAAQSPPISTSGDALLYYGTNLCKVSDTSPDPIPDVLETVTCPFGSSTLVAHKYKAGTRDDKDHLPRNWGMASPSPAKCAVGGIVLNENKRWTRDGHTGKYTTYLQFGIDANGRCTVYEKIWLTDGQEPDEAAVIFGPLSGPVGRPDFAPLIQILTQLGYILVA
jgi:hypothetical protein